MRVLEEALMSLVRLEVLLLVALQVTVASGARFNALQRANKALDLSEFEACGGTRALTKMETVKAKAFATRVVARCAPQTVVTFATGLKVPDFFILILAKISCLGVFFMYSYFSEGINLVIPARVTGDELLKLIERMMAIRTKARPIVKYRNPRNASDVFHSHSDFLTKFVIFMSKCVFEVDHKPPLDGNLVLEVIRYYKFVLF